MEELADPSGRRFSYLRLSVTEACNFRCVYCLPEGYRPTCRDPEPLRVEEAQRLVRAFAELGVWKVRLTGGEPLVRQDIVDMARAIAGTPGIRQVALSTNAYRLAAIAPQLRAAGVSALNISLDSLDPRTFSRIAGRPHLARVLEAIDLAIDLGFPSIKLNTVLLRGINDGELETFLEWVRERPVCVRFIELMRTADNRALFEAHHVSGQCLEERLTAGGWRVRPRKEGDGPARELRHPDYRGSVGIIAPYSRDFCASCNRLRVTSQGALRLCLFGEGQASLRPLLQSDGDRDALKRRIITLLSGKPIGHRLLEGRYGDVRHLAAIGG